MKATMTTDRRCSVCVWAAPGPRGPRGVCPQLPTVPVPGLWHAVELLDGGGEASRPSRSSLRHARVLQTRQVSPSRWPSTPETVKL